MSSPIDNRFESSHSPEDIWRALNTPLSGKARELVYPWLLINYEDLGEDGLLQAGTGISFVPSDALIDKVPEMFRSRVPKDINLRVGDHDTNNRVRTDVVESSKAEGSVSYRVEEGEGSSGILVVEGELSVGGMLSMAEGMAIEHGVYQPAQRTLDHLPQIL